MTNLDELEKLARAATQERWEPRFWRSPIDWPDGETYLSLAAHGPLHKETNAGIFQVGADIEFIVAAQPRAVLTLLGEIRQLRTERAEAREVLEMYANACWSTEEHMCIPEYSHGHHLKGTPARALLARWQDGGKRE